MQRPALIYVSVILLFGAGLWALLSAGNRLEPPRPSLSAISNLGSPVSGASPRSVAGSPGLRAAVRTRLGHPLGRLLLQLIVIVLAARVCGALFQKIGQPPVIGEVLAGIVLGPSVFGALVPRAAAFVFEASSLGTLRLLAEIGVLLFLFAVGLELDVSRLRHQAHTAVVVSHASIIVP